MSEKPTYKELEQRIKELGSRTSSRNREDQGRIQKLYLEQLFESAPEAIAMGDRNHNVLRINSEFTRLFGYTAEETIGVSIDDLIAPPELLDEAVSTSKAVTAETKEIAFET